MGEANRPHEPLRVALLAGTLRQGGAERQLVYIARVLSAAGAAVQVYSLSRGEYYEPLLASLGLPPIWVGRLGMPPARLARFTAELGRFRPHVIQAAHAYANLYAGLAGRVHNALSVGSLQTSLSYSLRANGIWGPWLFRVTDALAVSSRAAVSEVRASGLIGPERVYLLANAVDLSAFDDARPGGRVLPDTPTITVAFVGRLEAVKRLDRFLHALALARRWVPAIRGMVVGHGPERTGMERLAAELGLLPHGVEFLGQQDNVPALLRQADMLVLTSEREGLPNVILEAMAARVPVVTMPAGDAAAVVQEGVTGYVVPMGDTAALAERMVQLARSPALRQQLGAAGRRAVEGSYSIERLRARLLAIYRDRALRDRNSRVLRALGDAGSDPDALHEVRA